MCSIVTFKIIFNVYVPFSVPHEHISSYAKLKKLSQDLSQLNSPVGLWNSSSLEIEMVLYTENMYTMLVY